MSQVKLSQNHPATLPFIDAIGKLVVNLGFVEALTLEFIHALQKDPLLYAYAKRLGLKDRIDMVITLVEERAPFDPGAKTELESVWKALRPHMELRNVVAHNPIMFEADSGASPGSVKHIGVLNLKPKDKSKDAELVRLEEIKASVDAVGKLAPKLDAAYKKIIRAVKERDI